MKGLAYETWCCMLKFIELVSCIPSVKSRYGFIVSLDHQQFEVSLYVSFGLTCILRVNSGQLWYIGCKCLALNEENKCSYKDI